MSGRREPYNVADAKQLDAILRRKKKIRAEITQIKTDALHWNRTHPNEPPFDTAFEDAMLAWLDGGCEGEMPVVSQ